MSNEIETPPPVLITEGSGKEQGGAAVRDMLLLVAALPAIVALLGKRDVVGLVNYIASAEFAPALGVLLAAGVVTWRQIKTRHSKKVLVAVGKSAPDAVAQVVQK